MNKEKNNIKKSCKTAKSKKQKDKVEKVSYNFKPEHMSLEEWQIALRKMQADKEILSVTEVDKRETPGDYRVQNPISRKEYKVVYRGDGSLWNYCSCMDFRTNQLGTCKHLESIVLWLKTHRRRVCKEMPPYTSVYLSYKGERKVYLRIGEDNAEEFKLLAEPYFTEEGVLRPEALDTVNVFLHEAFLLNDTFRCYSDALSFIVEKRDTLKRLQILPEVASDAALDSLLKAELFPYQKEGIRFAFRAGKSIIADEMGLGKTIQAIGTAELMREQNLISSALIICPTSLKYQWKKEIERFTDAKAVVVEGNHLKRLELYAAKEFYKIVSYNSICNDIKILKTFSTDFLIMDEVQRLKNWNTQISKAARNIQTDYSIALSGTPLENKLEELYSIMQFVDQYCLGPYYKFMDNTVVKLDTGKVVSYKNLNSIGEQMKNVLIRRRKRDVALQLPERMDKILFVPMTEQQREMHDECQCNVSQLIQKWTRHRFLSEKDRKRLLLLLSQMRMLCDSTYILDQKSRHDTKVEETMNILKTVFESGDDKVVIFSQWERMTRLIAAELDKLDIGYEYLHGGVPSKARKDLVDNFTDQAEKRVFLSTDAGSTGLNLQVASLLINLDLPWNPAVLEQRIARIYRIGQKKNIQVINLVAGQTIEERMLSTLNFKSSLFEGILDHGDDVIFLENSKLDKIMDNIKAMTDPITSTEKDMHAGSDVLKGDREESENDENLGNENVQDLDKGSIDDCSPDKKQEQHQGSEPYKNDNNSVSDKSLPTSPEDLVQHGFAFLSGLARALSSPEETTKLLDSIVKEDKDTGETSLNIPVPDKETVANILSMFGKLLQK